MSSAVEPPRICVIGAGPSGMAVLYQYSQVEGTRMSDIVCYEKQRDWGGLWNYTWRTGRDEFGEPCHSGMYRHLWSNSPKENVELPDYTFEHHFGKVVPSYVPRPVYRDYLEGRWSQKGKCDLKSSIKFNTVVRNVTHDINSDTFTVTAEDLVNETSYEEEFTHVIVAVGIFNVPNIPDFPGLITFPGRVMHCHDFRNAHEFSGQRVLIIGSSYSAEDIAMQCYKFGTKHVICSWKTKPMGIDWPKEIEERPLVANIDGNVISFRDNTTAEVDSILYCTGYAYSFPMMEEKLRLRCKLSMFPDNLYKGVLWRKAGNNKCFYIGVQNQLYTFTMFDMQALWICRYILGCLKGEPVSDSVMTDDMITWSRANVNVIDTATGIDFQTNYLQNLSNITSYTMNAVKSRDLLKTWLRHKKENIMTFREHSFASFYTGNKTPQPGTWLEAFDDSLAAVIGSAK